MLKLARRFSLLPGLTASLVLLAIMLGLRALLGVLSLPELIEDYVLALLPGEIFSLALERLEHLGKPFLLGSLVLLQLILGCILFGVVIGALGRRHLQTRSEAAPSGGPPRAMTRRRAVALAVSGVAAAVSTASLWHIIQVGAAGVPAPTGANPDASLEQVVRTDRTPASPAAPEPAPRVQIPSGVSERVTPTSGFYVVSKNFADPEVVVDRWSLEIGGLVDNPISLSYAELLNLPSVKVERTLECISNPIGGRLIGNAVWRGVAFDELLDLAGLRDEANEIVFTCADGYREHLPIGKILEGTTLLAHTMNDRPLTSKHGFPARVLTTGLYGMKNPKWVQRIEAADRTDPGYWERRGWKPAAPIQTMSRIDTPRPGALAATSQLEVGGIAFAAERGIQRVEISLDQGRTWVATDLEETPSPRTWARWGAQVMLPAGESQIMVRAVDGTGVVQDAALRRSFPAGATGYHRVLVKRAEEVR